MLPPKALKAFGEFVANAHYLLGLVGTAATSAVLVSLVAALGPPWPDATTIALFTALAELVTFIWCFVFYLQAKGGVGLGRLQQLLRRAICCLGGFCIAYLVVFLVLVMHLDDEGNTEAKGIYTQWARSYAKDNPGATAAEVFKAAGANGEKAFIPVTLDASRLLVLLVWLAAYISLSATLCIFIIYQYRKKRG
jgi:hypothetical protein